MRTLRRAGLTTLAVVAALALVFLAQREIMTRAFDRLEADGLAQDAARVKFALDAELRLLTGYGSTNSVWDDSSADVAAGDREAFAADFPPADLKAIYGVDGIVGTAPDGTPRVGGLAGADGYARPPAELLDPAVLRGLFDAGGEPGAARCGALLTASVPYLYCGFAAWDSASQRSTGGLVYLKALDRAALATIGQDIALPVAVVPSVRSGAHTWPSITGRLGTLGVRTTTLGADRIALSVTVPATGGDVVLETVRSRPVHATATTVGEQLFGVVVVLGAALLAGLFLVVRRETRARVQPLLRTTEAVMASGNRSLRIGSTDRSEIGALARTIDGMLDAIEQQERRLGSAQEERERELAGSFAERQRAEDEAARAAGDAVRRTVEAVSAELGRVVEQLGDVREAARTIDARVAATDAATRGVAEEAQTADRVTADLSASLQQVAGVAGMIAGVAEQTRLLALNATIEAARAGPAGRGFTVVASEVKGLADETSRSTGRISETVASLGEDATAVTRVIAGMVDRISAIGEAATGLSHVAEQQRETLDRLETSVAEAGASVRRLADRP